MCSRALQPLSRSLGTLPISNSFITRKLVAWERYPLRSMLSRSVGALQPVSSSLGTLPRVFVNTGL